MPKAPHIDQLRVCEVDRSSLATVGEVFSFPIFDSTWPGADVAPEAARALAEQRAQADPRRTYAVVRYVRRFKTKRSDGDGYRIVYEVPRPAAEAQP